MAFETWTPPVAPRVAGTSEELEFRDNAATFGDGYEQHAPDGLNPIGEKWVLSWPGINTAHAEAIKSFVKSKGLWMTFWYKVPGQAVAKRFRFTSFVRPHVDGLHDGVTVGIRESFEIEE